MKIAIIPAAGSGTRMKELGKNYAKTVLPYMGSPILSNIIDSIESVSTQDEYRIVYSNESHYQQLTEALISSFPKELLDKIILIKADSSGRQGPAKSIISALSGVSSNDELLIHLSDFICTNLSPIALDQDQISVFEVNDPARWCMVDPNTIEFFDKPKTPVPTKMAVAGTYRLSNASTLLSVSVDAEESGSGEFQISELLSRYNEVHKLSVKVVPVSSIKDFGTIEEYIQNRGISVVARDFNRIIPNGKFLDKAASIPSAVDKLRKEHNWYKSLPKELDIYAPKVYNFWETPIQSGYTMEMIRSTNLREIYIYFDRSEETWDEIFKEVQSFIKICQSNSVDSLTSNFWDSIFEKNYDRIKDSPYRETASAFLFELHRKLKNSRFYTSKSLFHGDLHFANMFYCFHYKQLKVIDPNGNNIGHWFYDVAKLYHSAVGKYDWIDSHMYSGVGIMDKGTDSVKNSFMKILPKIGIRESEYELLQNLTASLFLTMIPLHYHSEKNQELFYEEFLRLATY